MTELAAEFDPSQYEADPRPSDTHVETVDGQRIAVIRNSDRVLFRRCRRKWNWNSHLRENLGPKTNADPLWLGSGFHFALEDIHGHKVWPSGVAALEAYSKATLKANRARVPPGYQDLLKLGTDMIDYYERLWLLNREPYKTYWYNGQPQCEVNFRIPLPWEKGKYGYDGVIYSGTLDRVVIDENGIIWIMEYKTAKTIQRLHYALDPQCSSYVWAGNHLYPGVTCGGVIYQQHRKQTPLPPKILSNGTISCAANLVTSHPIYRKALIDLYGSIQNAPVKNIDYMNELLRTEDSMKDKFVERQKVYRNEHQCQAEGEKILMELEEMLNPDLPMYPSPSRDCAYLCDFNGTCVSLDDGSDWESDLKLMFEPRDRVYDSWRKYLEVPSV